jgi:hypothetical protein
VLRWARRDRLARRPLGGSRSPVRGEGGTVPRLCHPLPIAWPEPEKAGQRVAADERVRGISRKREAAGPLETGTEVGLSRLHPRLASNCRTDASP